MRSWSCPEALVVAAAGAVGVGVAGAVMRLRQRLLWGVSSHTVPWRDCTTAWFAVIRRGNPRDLIPGSAVRKPRKIEWMFACT